MIKPHSFLRLEVTPPLLPYSFTVCYVRNTFPVRSRPRRTRFVPPLQPVPTTSPFPSPFWTSSDRPDSSHCSLSFIVRPSTSSSKNPSTRPTSFLHPCKRRMHNLRDGRNRIEVLVWSRFPIPYSCRSFTSKSLLFSG